MAGNDVIEGGAGSDTLDFYNATSGVNASLAIGRSYGGEGNDTFSDIENLQGGSFGDTLIGDDGANRLEGYGGNDSVSGGGGADYLWGGDGADSLYGGGGADYLWGGDGADSLYGGEGAQKLVAALAAV